ncbi:MAG: hypothetical protein ACJATT_004950 [Myxococcota bacterium]|jgi:hypothetical protein
MGPRRAMGRRATFCFVTQDRMGRRPHSLGRVALVDCCHAGEESGLRMFRTAFVLANAKDKQGPFLQFRQVQRRPAVGQPCPSRSCGALEHRRCTTAGPPLFTQDDAAVSSRHTGALECLGPLESSSSCPQNHRSSDGGPRANASACCSAEPPSTPSRFPATQARRNTERTVKRPSQPGQRSASTPNVRLSSSARGM